MAEARTQKFNFYETVLALVSDTPGLNRIIPTYERIPDSHRDYLYFDPDRRSLASMEDCKSIYQDPETGALCCELPVDVIPYAICRSERPRRLFGIPFCINGHGLKKREMFEFTADGFLAYVTSKLKPLIESGELVVKKLGDLEELAEESVSNSVSKIDDYMTILFERESPSPDGRPYKQSVRLNFWPIL